MENQPHNVEEQLNAYKRKYQLGLVVKGSLLTILAVTSVFVIGSIAEYTLWLGSPIRTILFFGIVLLFIGFSYQLIVVPLLYFINKNKGVNDFDAAKNIGKSIPSINDKLLNYIQLKSYKGNNSLLQASLFQKQKSMESIAFASAIDLRSSLKTGRYLILPFVVIVLLSLWDSQFFITSSKRIIQFNEDFVPQAPFEFEVNPNPLLAYENEDFTLDIQLSGHSIPENIYLIDGNRKIKIHRTSTNTFSYTYSKIKGDKSFYLEGAGFRSAEHNIKTVARPSLIKFDTHLKYPPYLKMPKEVLKNTGNLEVPQGTTIKWLFQTNNTEELSLSFKKDNKEVKETTQTIDNQLFEYEKQVLSSYDYNISLVNQYGSNSDLLNYHITVKKDKFPSILLNAYQDTTLYSYVVLGGNVSDDYGVSALKLFYSANSEKYKSINIPIDKKQANQSFYYQWVFDSLMMTNTKELKYYLEVWDNDGINGKKSAKTGTYLFHIPDKNQIKDKIKKSSKKTENELQTTIEEAKELQNKLKEVKEKLKGKKELSWQDQRLIEELMDKKKQLDQAIEELQKQQENINQKKDRFTEQDEKIKEKADQLQKLMNEMLDEETKKLYEELQKLLEEQSDVNQIQDLLNNIDQKENNLEKELERTLELFKRMKVEFELNEAINKLKEEAEQQENLSNQSDDKKSQSEDLLKQQEELNKDFEKSIKDFEEVNDLNQELENPLSMPDMDDSFEDIKEHQKNAAEQLQNNKKNKAGNEQKNAADKMKQAAEQMEQMMAGMEMNMMQENLDDLRDIVHNLLTLSFDQEALMNEFRTVDQSDPRFVELSQKQVQLKDDAVIVKDSLESLANRVFQIASFVTREIGDMNNYMDESAKAIKERKKELAVSKQQFTMTSMNNLALLLDDVLQQMQQQMADAMGQPKPGDKNQKNMPGLSELQQQLNEKIQELKESGKQGRQLSEELAKLAAEQERIRKALEDAQEKYEGQNNGEAPGKGITDKMEETELDLVNKKITKETIKRQKEIMTRLLEAEDALREDEMEETREAQTATEKETLLPEAFEEYFKMKEKEVELLKTIPPKLYPYYKKEINDYFKRLGNSNTTQHEHNQN